MISFYLMDIHYNTLKSNVLFYYRCIKHIPSEQFLPKNVQWFIMQKHTPYTERRYSTRKKSFNCQFSSNSRRDDVEHGVSRACCKRGWWKIAWLIRMPLFSPPCQLQWIFKTETTGAVEKDAKRKWQIFRFVCTSGVNHK